MLRCWPEGQASTERICRHSASSPGTRAGICHLRALCLLRPGMSASPGQRRLLTSGAPGFTGAAGGRWSDHLAVVARGAGPAHVGPMELCDQREGPWQVPPPGPWTHSPLNTPQSLRARGLCAHPRALAREVGLGCGPHLKVCGGAIFLCAVHLATTHQYLRQAAFPGVSEES